MQRQFAELIGIARLQRLMDAFYKVAGIPSAILDRDLTILAATGWQDICLHFHRAHPETLENCKNSDNFLIEGLQSKAVIKYSCKNGMVNYAYPIIIKGRQLATLCIGQFLLEPPSEEFFREQAGRYGFDEAKYMKALKKVPIIREEQIGPIIAFFMELAKIITDIGLKSIKQLESATFLRELMNAIPNPIFYKDIKGIYQGCNKAFEDFHGLSQSEIIGKSVYDLSPNELAVKYEAMDSELFTDKKVQVYEYQATNAQGEKREVIFSKAPYLNLEKQVTGLVGVMVDITRKKELEVALKNSEAKYRALFNNLFDGFVYFERVLDSKGTIIDYQILEVNAAFEKMTGNTASELIGKKISESIFRSENVKFDLVSMLNQMSNRGKSQAEEYFSNPLQKWFLLSSYSPQPGYCAIVMSDITEQKQKIEQAQYYAYHDYLTGLPNRRLFDDRLSLAIARSKREGGLIAVIFIDMDKFKSINDTMGHEGGDILLQEVAQRLLSCVRAGDTVSRLGGDEFVLILPCLKDYREANIVADRILEACRQPFYIKNQMLQLSASIGISFFPDNGDDASGLIRSADMAMYLCKKQGRNRICYASKDGYWSGV